jgi:hypothetical protein
LELKLRRRRGSMAIPKELQIEPLGRIEPFSKTEEMRLKE